MPSKFPMASPSKRPTRELLRETARATRTDNAEAPERGSKRPVADGCTRVSFREIERKWAALNALSERALPSDDADDKVFTLLRRHYEPGHDVFMARRNKIIKHYPAPQGKGEDEIPDAVKEARAIEIEDLLDATFDIPTVPASLILTAADMPVHMKGEAGKANRVSLAWIKNRLGDLYPLADERPALVHDDEEE